MQCGEPMAYIDSKWEVFENPSYILAAWFGFNLLRKTQSFRCNGNKICEWC